MDHDLALLLSEGSMRKKSVNEGGDAPAQTNPDDRRSTLPEAEAACREESCNQEC